MVDKSIKDKKGNDLMPALKEYVTKNGYLAPPGRCFKDQAGNETFLKAKDVSKVRPRNSYQIHI